MGFAVVALGVAVVTAIVVATRGTPAASSDAVRDRHVAASDLLELPEAVEPTDGGVKVRGARLAGALGLVAGDVITAMSGRPTTSAFHVREVLLDARMTGATTLYVELAHAGQPVLARWRLDGALRGARADDTSLLVPPVLVPPSVLGGPGDPLLDSIEKLDDTHVRIPRATVEAMLADPMKYLRGGRIVPSVGNGRPDGFKLYAVRPDSLFARLGFQNGDKVRAVNGFELTSPDKALELYTKLRSTNELTIDLDRRGDPKILTITIR